MNTLDSQLEWEQLELFSLMQVPYDVPLITPVIKENTNDQTRKN